MMKFIRQGNYCLFSHIHKLIKMASDGHAKIYFVLGKLKLSLSCMKSVSSKSIDWACSSNQCFDALIEIKELSSQFQANNSLYILFNCRWRLQSIRHIIYLQYSYKKFEILDTYISTKCCQLNSSSEFFCLNGNENCSPSLFTFFNWSLTLVHIYSYIYNALYVQSKHMQMSNHAINYSRREHNPFFE